MTNLLDMEVAQLESSAADPDDCRGLWIPSIQATPIGVDQGGNMHINVVMAIPRGVLKELDRTHASVLLNAQGEAPPPNLQDALALLPMVRLVVKAEAMTDEALESLDSHIKAETQTMPDAPANGV